MKAIKMRIQKSSRPLVVLLATVVVIITSVVVANATQTITTPNAAFASYIISPGLTSAAITPVTSRPVLVMGCCTTTNDQAVGQVSLFHVPGNGMRWVGLESFFPTGITEGSTSVPGSHIVFIDKSHFVDIQVASADTIYVHNSSAFVVTVNVTLIW